MNRQTALRHPVSLPIALAVSLALSACGGGGGGTDTAATTATTTAPATAVNVNSDANNGQATSGTTTVNAASSADELLAAEVAAAIAQPTAAAEEVPAARIESIAASVVADARNGQLIAGGAPTMQAQAVTAAVPGNVYYVDSVRGSDSNTGRQETGQAGGLGPWKTLSKLTQAMLQPGDAVRLACGSSWNETLRLASSGTATAPIAVTSWPLGCANRPTIDGSTAIAPAAWVQHQGNIWRAPLAAPPLQLFATSGLMTAAHHPNAGSDANMPDSVYARIAADGNRLVSGGRTVSTTLPIGTDLKLPVGAVISPGTTVRVRSNSWTLEERTVASATATTVTLSTPTTYPLSAGWGYYLMGQQWMLDSAGEWYWDSNAKQLFAWMPDSRAPATPVRASQLAAGVDLQQRQFVTLDNLAVKMVGTGLDLRRSVGVEVRNSTIEDVVGFGVNASGSQATTVQSNTINRTGLDAVTGQDDSTPAAAAAMRVLDNTISSSAVLMNGEKAVSLPVVSRAAIRPGGGALVTGNTVVDAAYIGILPLAGSTVSNNTVRGACSTLDDCAGIYVSGALHNTTISGNVVSHSRGALAGKPSNMTEPQAQGIYLDESASLVTISGNTVTDCDYGIHLHVSARNTITQNVLFGNRNAQLWLQETRNRDNVAGDVFANTVTANQVVPTSGSSRGLLLQTVFAETARFGSFDQNRFFDRLFGNIVDDRFKTGSNVYNFAQWRMATDLASVSRANEANGWAASQLQFAATRVIGSNVVPNGNFAQDSKGWTTWNQTAPKSYIVREACPAGWCIRFNSGGSVGLISSPNFATTAGNWYRISVDVLAGADKQPVYMVARRGGGGTNGYESLSDRSLKITAGRTWTRYSQVFKATKTINVNDPVTKDLGARLDFEGLAPGQTISVANVEIVPVFPAEVSSRVDLLLNATAAPTQVACPVAGTQPAACADYVLLHSNQPVVWPHYLAGRSSAVVYTLDRTQIDTDADGIPDSQDGCAATPAGAAVNSRGCSFGQN